MWGAALVRVSLAAEAGQGWVPARLSCGRGLRAAPGGVVPGRRARAGLCRVTELGKQVRGLWKASALASELLQPLQLWETSNQERSLSVKRCQRHPG